MNGIADKLLFGKISELKSYTFDMLIISVH